MKQTGKAQLLQQCLSSQRQYGRHVPSCGRHMACAASQDSQSVTEATVKTDDLVRLGKSELFVSSIGVGTLSWGDPKQGWQERFQEQDLKEMCNCASLNNINFYDTAEVRC